jgi:hypothetical protein
MIQKRYDIRYYFPSHDDIENIGNGYPFHGLQLNMLNNAHIIEYDKLREIRCKLEIDTWITHFLCRAGDLKITYWIMEYYFQKGIPDKTWFISPGRDGSSIEYFPYFKAIDFSTKLHFDYFSNIFYVNLFSAWDIIGHILNEFYLLNIPKRKYFFDLRI